MKKVRVQGSRKEIETGSGKLAERMASVEYGYNASRSGSYYDAERDSGAKIEVKSTFRMIGRDYRAKGRFRIPEPQHKKLVQRDRSGSAFYVFVLYDGDTQRQIPQDAYMKRINPADIGNLIGAMGGFENSGHKSFDREKKLPWTTIFTELS